MELNLVRKTYAIAADYIISFVVVMIVYVAYIGVYKLVGLIVDASSIYGSIIALILIVVTSTYLIRKYFRNYPRRYIVKNNHIELKYLFKSEKIYLKKILAVEVKKYGVKKIIIIKMEYADLVIYGNTYTNVEDFLKTEAIAKKII